MSLKQNKMGVVPIPKLIIAMSLPAMISMMTQALYNIVDSIFVAQINEEAITALSMAFPVQLIIIACFVGMGVGINSLTSRKLGEKDFASVRATAEHGYFIATLLYITIALLGLLTSRAFFEWFTDDPLIIEYGSSYLQIIMLFSFGRIYAQAGMSILQGSGEMVFPMIAQIAGAIINVILDPIFIFGWFGLPAMGVRGAAIATVTAQTISLVVVLVFVFKIKKSIPFEPQKFKLDLNILKSILVVGFPAAIMQALASVMLTGLNLILVGFSTTAVAVLGIYYKLQSFVFMPIFGLSQGMMPIIGYNYGAREKKRLIHAIRFGLGFAVLYMSVGMLGFQLFSRHLILLFNGTEEMLAIGTRAFGIISLTYPLTAVSIMFSTTFQGLGEAHYSMFVSFIRQIVILLPLAYLLSKLGNIDVIWYAFIIAESIGVISVLIFFRHIYHKRIKSL